MTTVCRFCACWSEPAGKLDEAIIDNILPNVAIKEIFGVEIACSPGLPNEICRECILLLENSLHFHERLLNAEKVFLTLLERGELHRRLTETKGNGGNILYNEEPVQECPDPEEEASDSSAINADEYWAGKPTEKVVEIKIEAIEELEIISAPLVTEQPDDAYIATPIGVSHDVSPEQHDFSGRNNDPAQGNVLRRIVNHRQTLSAQDMSVVSVPNRCYICDSVYPSGAELMAHLIVHNDKLPYRCRKCSTNDRTCKFRTIHALNKHLETHTFPFECSTCPLHFRKQTTLYEHMRNVHWTKGSFTCEFCGQYFDEQPKFRKHMSAHRNMQTERYKCPVCSKLFQTGTLLKRHQLTHASADGHFQCQHCNRRYTSQANLARHEMRHLWPENVYPCQEVGCGVTFTNFLEWRRHMKGHFPDDMRYWEADDMLPESMRDPDSYPRRCNEEGCEYVARTVTLMWSHYRGHYKSFKCLQCESVFSNPTNLRLHVEVRHMGVRRFGCNICGKRFPYRHKLKEHLNAHNGVRNLKCKYCPKRFAHSSHLVVHQRRHTGDGSLRCQRCEMDFTSLKSLAQHSENCLQDGRHRKNLLQTTEDGL